MFDVDEISVLELVNDFLKRKAIEDDTRDNSYFHPSEFYGCKRQIAYKYHLQQNVIKIISQTNQIDPRLERIFDNGNYIHFRWRDYLQDKRCAKYLLKGHWKCKNVYAHESAWKVNKQKGRKDCKPQFYGKDKKLGITYPEETCDCGCPDFEYVEIGFLDPEILLGGHIDSLLISPTGKHIILDYKSINKRGYDKIWSKPKPEHYMQMQCYLCLSGVDSGKFIYECKDDQNVKEINVSRDQPLINQIVSNAKNLKEIVTTVKENGKRILPPRSNSLNPKEDKERGIETKEYNKGMAECMRCPFRKYCWKL